MAVRVAMAQFRGHRDRGLNLDRAAMMAREAAAGGARLVCFPEICNCMYFCQETRPEYRDWAEPVEGGASVARMREVAAETGLTIVFPMYERDGARLFSSAVVIDPDGAVQGVYRKSSIARMSHVDPGETTSNEKYYFDPGDTGFTVFTTPSGLRFGILICRDRHYAEAARVIGLAGAHLLLVPAATFREWARRVWDVELRAHAIQNCYYVAAVNKVGPDAGGAPDRDHFGSSVIIDPRGAVMAMAGREHDEIVYADVEPDMVEATRLLTDFYADRRPDLYASIA